ncbi:MAG: transglycosylase SLT domain-containing protein [Bacteroidota bacterium]
MPYHLIRTLLLFLFLPLSLSASPWNDLDEELVEARLDSIASQVSGLKYDKIVASYLRTYTKYSRDKSERILGKSLVYFPIFEKHLKAQGLPEDLKYLPIVESALEPRAVSSAGAVGLWQFMAETGRYYGLEVTPQVDERCDPEKATKAAVAYLQNLYKRFGNWELAIAAYNSGGGRVSRAIKRARSKDYYRIKRYLPRETANYVPAFIAATYLMKFYEEHHLVPKIPSLDAQITETISLNQPFSFYQIAQISGATIDIIEQLNPAYPRSNIPARGMKMRSLTLPKRHMVVFKAYLEAEHSPNEKKEAIAMSPVLLSQPIEQINNAYEQQVFTLKAGETIDQLAESINIPSYQLQFWNNLKQDHYPQDEYLTAFVAIPPQFKNPMNLEMPPVSALPVAQKEAPAEETVHPKDETITALDLDQYLFQDEYLFYWARKKERVSEIADKIPGVTTQDIMTLNGFKKDKVVKADARIKVKALSK